MTVLAIATQQSRLALLKHVVAALRPQVDALRVYLNDFDIVPDFLEPGEGLLGKDAAGDLGAEGKFYWFDKDTSDYYLTADDDLLYPSDYVATLIREFEARQRRAIVGVHGFVFDMPLVSYNNSRKERYKCTRALDSPRPVHVVGTATAILHQDTIKLSMDDFPRKNMADLQLAIAAQRQHVPMVVIPRQEGWIQELADRNTPTLGPSIWQTVKADGGRTKAAIAREAVPQWQLFPDTLEI